MKRTLSFLALAITLNLTGPAAAAGKLSGADLIGLQAALQSHIDVNLVDGAMLQMDASGSIDTYFPLRNHPKIMTAGDFLVMCADFVDSAGNPVMANFYVKSSAGQYVFFDATFGADPALEALMKSGAATMAN